jgi:hypothetical protein
MKQFLHLLVYMIMKMSLLPWQYKLQIFEESAKKNILT